MTSHLPLPITAIAITGLGMRLRSALAILAERAADVVTFLELAARGAADVTLVRAGVDQFAFSTRFSGRHDGSLVAAQDSCEVALWDQALPDQDPRIPRIWTRSPQPYAFGNG